MSFDKTFDGSDAHLPPADAAACVAFLRGYQEWRRWIGAAPLAEEGPAMPHPKSIGFAIDMAIRLIEQRGELLAALEVARLRIAIDREALFDCHKDRTTNTVTDELGLRGLAEYDDALCAIKSATASAKGSA
jgi:hypothetical protein